MTAGVLLIGGTGRSGSTLLSRLLAELPGFVAVGELRYLWTETLPENRLCGCGTAFRSCPFWTKVGERAFGNWGRVDLAEVAALQRTVARHRHVPLLLIPGGPPARLASGLQRYRRLLDATYRAIREVSSADVVVDSTKDAAHAVVLRGMPGADVRLAHLVRDSRGVAWSWEKVVRSPDVVDREHYLRRFSPLVTALRWNAYNLMIESLGRLGVPRLLVRYERLTSDPVRTLGRVAAFAGRPADSGALAEIESGLGRFGIHHTVAGNPMRLSSGSIDVRPDDAWRTAMPRSQRLLVAGVTWPLLRHYERKSDAHSSWPAPARELAP